MKVHFNNRKRTVNFRSETELVEWMRKHDAEYSRNIMEFMEAYGMRKSLFYKIILDTNSPRDFVNGLVSNNIIAMLR